MICPEERGNPVVILTISFAVSLIWLEGSVPSTDDGQYAAMAGGVGLHPSCLNYFLMKHATRIK